MKKIKIKIIGLGYKDINQAIIDIYKGNKLIISNKTYNNELDVILDENKTYKLIATTFDKQVITSIFTNTDCYYVNFNFLNPVTFKLTDFYYKNLPIERGTLILWQKQL